MRPRFLLLPFALSACVATSDGFRDKVRAGCETLDECTALHDEAERRAKACDRRHDTRGECFDRDEELAAAKKMLRVAEIRHRRDQAAEAERQNAEDRARRRQIAEEERERERVAQEEREREQRAQEAKEASAGSRWGKFDTSACVNAKAPDREASCKNVNDYLSQFPRGLHAAEAEQILARSKEADRDAERDAERRRKAAQAERVMRAATENIWHPGDADSPCCRGHGGVRGCAKAINRQAMTMVTFLQCMDGSASSCGGCE